MDEPFGRVLALYEQGRFLDAWEAGRAAGPLESWPGTGPRMLAARLAARLGAARRSRLLVHRAFRADRTHPGAQYYHVSGIIDRLGPFAAWRERRRLGEPAGAGPSDLGDYCGQCAMLLAALRDFPAAERHLERGWAAAPGRPYGYVERATLAAMADRTADALAAAEEGLASFPRYPPLIVVAAANYLYFERHDDAMRVLRRGLDETQSADVARMLARVLLKLRRLDDAEAVLARHDALVPLAEPDLVSWVASSRAEIALRRRDYAATARLLDDVRHPFHAAIAANLRACLEAGPAADPRRTELSVPYVRQHHRTCSPATLTAISRFWGRPADHLAVAEEICYDGTPAYSERRWADGNGWVTREFRVDWPSAVALLDRGIPFTLTLSAPTGGHLVAVMGYDEATRQLLARDPSTPETVEINATGLLEELRATGPRGMALVPDGQAGLLDGLDLPESGLYGRYHALQLALEVHDRDRAVAERNRLEDEAPGHRLALAARLVLANYDASAREARAAIADLLARYPDDHGLQLQYVQSLRGVAPRDERLAWLEEALRRPGAHAMLRLEHAIELGADERSRDAARWALRRALRWLPADPRAIALLGEQAWREGRQAEGTELYRIAACLDELREPWAQTYFGACRWLRDAETGLAFLRERCERIGARSALPAMTLFGALESLDRTPEGFAALDAILRQRPDDGDLRVFAAGACARYGRHEEAAVHLAAAEGKVKRALWLAAAARDARLRGDRARALACWQDVLATQPLDLEAHHARTQLIAEAGDAGEAVHGLDATCAAFPHHAGLHRLLYEWTRGRPAAEREAVLRRMLAIDRADTWALRELALNLAGQGRLPEALVLAETALATDSRDAANHGIVGHLQALAGRSTDAEAAFRAALLRSGDETNAIWGLVEVCDLAQPRRHEVVGFIADRVTEGSIVGDGVLAFRQAVRGVLTPAELRDVLRNLHERRPDLWQTWSALCQHLAEMGETDAALDLARRAVERFPTVLALHLDLSRVHRLRLEAAERVAVLERGRDLDAEAVDPVVELADAYAQAGRLPDAERLLESAIQRTPLAVPLRGNLAALLQQRGDLARAVEVLQHALRIAPDYAWAWERLVEWSRPQGRATVALDLAREFAESRQGESQPWVRLADLQLRAGRADAALASADRAITVHPGNVMAHDMRAAALASLRRFREAAEACRPDALGAGVPANLAGRAAWVEAGRGNVTGAIDLMRAVLRSHPEYRWGWERILDWTAALGRNDEALEAAVRLVWLSPGEVAPLGWQGELQLRLGRPDLALAAFRRALQLQPSYVHAGTMCVALQCDGRDIDGAQRTIEIMRPYAPPDTILAAETTVALTRNDRDAALGCVRALCRLQGHDGSSLLDAAARVADAGWARDVERVLREATVEPGWHAAAPVAWARVRARRGGTAALDYGWLRGLGPAGCDAVCEILDALADRGRRDPGVTWELLWIRAACAAFRADDRFWGRYAFVLAGRGSLRAQVRWMRDWRARRQLEPWMYQILAFALLARHDEDEARHVLRAVIRDVLPSEGATPLLRTWCAIAACLDGELDRAGEILYATPDEALAPPNRPLRAYAEALLESLRRPRGGGITPEYRSRLASARAVSDPASARLLFLASMRAAQHAGARWTALRESVNGLPAPNLWRLGGALLLIGVLARACGA